MVGMGPSAHVKCQIDLGRVRENVSEIRRVVGTGVAVMAVVKADAYGLGAARVVEAVSDLVQGYCVFSLAEAAEAEIQRRTGKQSLALGPAAAGVGADAYIAAGVRPGVCSVEQAEALRAAGPAVNVDTGQQRFACPAEKVGDVMRAAGAREAFTHASRVEQAERLVSVVEAAGLERAGVMLHAAGTSLLSEPAARLDGVRPGLAMYRGAARVSTRLAEARDTRGPVGYTGFLTPRVGVILCGYSNGYRTGVCVVNGQRRRVVEVGMQSAFVELAPGDRAGDEVVLLGGGLTEAEVAGAWGTTPHEALVRLCGCGRRDYGVG